MLLHRVVKTGVMYEHMCYSEVRASVCCKFMQLGYRLLPGTWFHLWVQESKSEKIQCGTLLCSVCLFHQLI